MATETFTLTLDDAPTESVSVTINDTSTSSTDPVYKGYITNVTGSYANRNYTAYDDTVVVWNKTNGNLTMYTNCLGLSSPGEITTSTVQNGSTAGIDSQGYYQIAIGNEHIYVARPLADNNQGALDVYAWDSTSGFLTNQTGTGSPLTGTGYLSTNNFGFYKIATAYKDNRLTVQDGYTGHRVQGIRDVKDEAPSGNNRFTLTSTSTTRFTRGIGCERDGAGQTFLYVTGRQPNASNQVVMEVHIDLPGGGSVSTNFTVTGTTQEVARHVKVARITSTDQVLGYGSKWAVLVSGTGDSTQLFRIHHSATNTISVTQLHTFTGGGGDNIAVFSTIPATGAATTGNRIGVFNDGELWYSINDGSSWTSWGKPMTLTDLSFGATSGMAYLTGKMLAVYSNNRVYCFGMQDFYTWLSLQ